MNDPQKKTNISPTVGELFARQYVERGAPLQDKLSFRNRLDGFLQTNHYKDYAELAAYLRQEAGFIVGTSYSETYRSIFYKFTDFFLETKIELVLSAITLIWRFLQKKYPEKTSTRRADIAFVSLYPKNKWHEFVSRALREENMAYKIDQSCGVHFIVDEEFERNRIATLSCLVSGRYAAVRVAFEQAHGYLDAQPADTKASVRSAFESLEIFARLIDPQSNNLNKWMVENKLKPLALGLAVDSTERIVIDKLFDALAIAVDGLHNYRHGQGSQQPVAPTLTTAVYVLSTVAAMLRWLAEIETRSASSIP